jgi:hypothetical protein
MLISPRPQWKCPMEPKNGEPGIAPNVGGRPKDDPEWSNYHQNRKARIGAVDFCKTPAEQYSESTKGRLRKKVS